MVATKLDAFTRAYLECALWSSTDDDGTPLDDSCGPDAIAPDALARMVEDCRRFRESHRDLYADGWSDEQAGHDFWLTRNGHGAGFWDRYDDCPQAEAGERLSDAARHWGTCNLYRGDDGLLYLA